MSFLPQIKSRFEVHHQEGDEVVCKCPFHDDGGKPNLYVNSMTGLYYCFVCGARGKVDSGTRPEMAEAAANLRSRLHRLREPESEIEVGHYPDEWLLQFLPSPYWSEERGFSERTIQRFHLGWDPVTGHLTIPIYSMQGNVLGVIYRRTDDVKPKYLHPRGFRTSRHLFGSHLVVQRHRKVALVEGPLDAIALWDAGIPALALYGARLSDGQNELLKKLGVQTVVVMTDNDRPGREAVADVKAKVRGMQVMVGVYQPHWGAKDPGELSKVRRKGMYHSALPYHQWKQGNPTRRP